jgi:hypothetical protein
MEQSPFWEADNFSIGKQISYLLWNPKVHYNIYKSKPIDPIMNYLIPIHTITLSFF